MQPTFVDRKHFETIKQDISILKKDEIKLLSQIGFLVKSKNIDDKLKGIFDKTYEEHLKNKITVLYMIPTNTCNLECKYCFIGKLNKKPVKMKIETAKHAIDLFQKHLTKINQKGKIFFYGAEPLLNFELIEQIVNYSKKQEYNIEFAMVSNGLLLTENIANFIKENNISLGISIDGPKSINDKNRVFKNSKTSVYDKVLDKINLLKECDVEFGLSITIAPSFLDDKEEFLNWLEKLNVKNISYNLLHFTYKTNEWQKYYNQATDFIYESNNRLFSKEFNEDRINRKYKSFYEREFKFADCAAVGGNQITICPDGSIEVCHGYWNKEKHILGNIGKLNDLEKLFDNNEFKKWQNFITLKKEKCIQCESIYICGGGCAMQSKDLFEAEDAVDEAFCIYTKNTLKKILNEVYNENLKK